MAKDPSRIGTKIGTKTGTKVAKHPSRIGMGRRHGTRARAGKATAASREAGR